MWQTTGSSSPEGKGEVDGSIPQGEVQAAAEAMAGDKEDNDSKGTTGGDAGDKETADNDSKGTTGGDAGDKETADNKPDRLNSASPEAGDSRKPSSRKVCGKAWCCSR